MGAYIFRRLWLMIPTLIGIMLINFTLIQFVPGGPIERIISQLESDSAATDRITGGGSEVQSGESSIYEGARGLPPDLIEDLEKHDELENTLIVFFSDNGACPYQRHKTPGVAPGPAELR